MRRAEGESTEVVALAAVTRSGSSGARAAGCRLADRAAAEANPAVGPCCDSEAAEEPRTKIVRDGSVVRCAVVDVGGDFLADRNVVAMLPQDNRGRSDVGGVRTVSRCYC